jgi:hypothetical protein
MLKDLPNSTMIDKNIRVAILSFKTEDFQLMNILGNRIMSDSLFLDTKYLSLVGFFIKQIALNYLNLKPRITESDYLDAKLIGEKYLDSLFNISKEVDKAKLWSSYHEFNIQIKQYSASELDKEIKNIYGEDPLVTTNVRRWLIEFLTSSKDILLDARNNFLKGIISELQRVGLSYGYEVMDTVIFSCLIALDRYYDYFRLRYSAPDDKIDEEAIRKIVFPHLDSIKRISSSDVLQYDDITNLLWELIKGWREFFIYYSELSLRTPERPIELSKESRTKLSEVLGKALQKELKT